ncbi:Uncharacterized protein TPAR_02198 [Tolypocladium paradoxum]|uniref:Major facilitator superfamily transporter n=1 Tax=Tolypocladium paradoxum TaxID=94208 RepID=A0A2S4L5A1_9HYPO|nr:Uncharacterized protein TPAR_02198 [Tolypocladium paradoxum]
MDKVLNPQGRRALLSRPRPRIILLLALASVTTYFLLFSGPAPQLHIVPYLQEKPGSTGSGSPNEKPLTGGGHQDEPTGTRAEWDIDIEDLRSWSDPDDHEDTNDALPGYETDGTARGPGDVGRLQHEKDLRKMWRYAYKTTANLKSSNLVYGNTLKTLTLKENRTEEQEKMLREDPKAEFEFSQDKPVRFNPYPDYNSDEWKNQGHGAYVPCKGPTGEFVEDLMVFKGRPEKWPAPKFGSYELMGMDPNLCWERDTRLGPYGMIEQKKKVGGRYEVVNWDNVNWGDLQQRCLKLNAERFDMTRKRKNEYLNAYPETAKPAPPPEKQRQEQRERERLETEKLPKREETSDGASDKSEPPKIKGRLPVKIQEERNDRIVKETRTAILLRSYTGMEYTDNDKQIIRALISELNLKTGGQYEVFLLVHSKKKEVRIFDDPETYQSVLRENVPPEFHGITVLWNDEQVWNIYTKMKDEDERSVHTAQWLSVQKFSHDHPQFDYIWNWEMDFRFTGHHYDLLDKLQSFAKRQPRKYLWERNERWYIPEYHGDYDTTFREDVARRHGDDTVWGPPDLPFINPVGPKPPVKSYRDDNYEWGVGEEADFITVGPMFDPIDSQWIIGNHIWGFSDENHKAGDLPRRTTIVTQSRMSKRLLDIMHVENMRGNHVASEMTPQTIALLHGFKTVFAPHPVFMDRDWRGEFLNKWFNPGPKGECGGRGSPMGWGRERRYQGTTWYYRAEPPNRLYNNWMGWIDTSLGGLKWEGQNGRPCLPSVMLHQVKNTEPTEADHKTGFALAYG